jgi:hypothetical protein
MYCRDASVTHERALETREPSYVPRIAKRFFILRGCGTRGSTGAPLSGRQSPETWDTWQHWCSPHRRQGPELRDTWQRRNSPQHGGEVRGRETRGGAGAHLCREVRSGAKGHVAASELTSARRRGPGPRDTWRHQSPPEV